MVEVSRGYFTCASKDCHYTEYPLNQLLGLTKHRAAGLFEEKICWLAAFQPFDHVRKYLELFEGISITETMIRETVEDRGLEFIKKDEEKANSISIPPAKPTETLYIQADGSMVPIRSECGKGLEYRENKLGLVFREEDILRFPVKKSHIKNKRFVNSLGQGVDHFEKLLERCALENGSTRARNIVFLSDGADWIDRMRQRLFPRSIHILDWYHAEEHLWDCAKVIFGETASQKHIAWVEPLKALLWDGLTEAVCEHLLFEAQRHPRAQTKIRELRSYYKNRIEKMNYPMFRRAGYFIGSGAVESANKYLVQARLKQAGMKWTIPGASSVIFFRKIVYENSWTQSWSRRAA